MADPLQETVVDNFQSDDWSCWDAFRARKVAPVFVPPVINYQRQPDQSVWFPEPDTNPVYWRKKKHNKPNAILELKRGLSGVAGTFTSGQCGSSRIQNNIAGWNVYIGMDSPPDISLPPSFFSLTLPISITVVPPVSGLLTVYVLVRKQDHYGLESQNQFLSVFTVTSAGVEQLQPVPVPQDLQLVSLSGRYVNVLAAYPTALTDSHPATLWKIWAGTTLPDPNVDIPLSTVEVSGKRLYATIGPLTVATYYVMVGLFRASDSALSPTIYSTTIVVAPPAEITAVPWFDLP